MKKKEMSLPDHWQVEESKIIHEDRWIKLRADRCRTPDGHLIDPYYVLEQSEWISILALSPEGSVIVTHEYRHGGACVGPALPGGVVEAGDDTPQACALRELGEETGYQAGEIIGLGSCYANWANQSNQVHYFLALDCAWVLPQSLDENEQISVSHVPLATVMEPGYLVQSFHLANLFLALPHLIKRGFCEIS